MMAWPPFIALVGLLVVSGCAAKSAANQATNGPANPSAPPSAYVDQGRERIDAKWIGKRISVVGVVENRKVGACVLTDAGEPVYVADEGAALLYDRHRVRATGVLTEQHDLPVFVEKPGEPAPGGIPVPPGTDLHAASRRLVLKDVKVELVN